MLRLYEETKEEWKEQQKRQNPYEGRVNQAFKTTKFGLVFIQGINCCIKDFK